MMGSFGSTAPVDDAAAFASCRTTAEVEIDLRALSALPPSTRSILYRQNFLLKYYLNSAYLAVTTLSAEFSRRTALPGPQQGISNFACANLSPQGNSGLSKNLSRVVRNMSVTLLLVNQLIFTVALLFVFRLDGWFRNV